MGYRFYMATFQIDRRGQVSVQVWIEKKTHQKVKARLASEGKYMKDIITKFLRLYGNYGQDEELHEDEETKTTSQGS